MNETMISTVFHGTLHGMALHEKGIFNELIYKTNRVTDVKNLWLPGGKEKGRDKLGDWD